MEKLEVMYERTDQVKDTRINILMSQYEGFKLLANETISDMNARFQKLVNSLKMLSKVIPETDQVKKILRSLSIDWQPMATVITQAKDLGILKMEELIRNLLTHELDLNQMKELIKKMKNIALKAKFSTKSKSESFSENVIVTSCIE